MLTDRNQKRIAPKSEVKGNNDIPRHPTGESPGADVMTEDIVTISSEDSFPASDAPAWTMGDR